MQHSVEAEKLKEKFPCHPLVFQRSMEHAKNLGELFDILDFMPKDTPIRWDDKEHRWVTISDLFLINKLETALGDNVSM